MIEERILREGYPSQRGFREIGGLRRSKPFGRGSLERGHQRGAPPGRWVLDFHTPGEGVLEWITPREDGALHLGENPLRAREGGLVFNLAERGSPQRWGVSECFRRREPLREGGLRGRGGS